MSRKYVLESWLGASKAWARAMPQRRLATRFQLEALEDRTAPTLLPPVITNMAINGGAATADFGGPQQSRVVELDVTFDEPVQLDAGAMTLALHTKNVSYAGIPKPQGMGVIPDLVFTPNADHSTWTVTFAGADTEAGLDGHASLVDGVYDFHIDGSKVHPVESNAINMMSDSTTTFARLFGDSDEPTTTSNGLTTDYSSVVNTGDNLAFRNAFNNPSTYKAYFDFDGDGVINTGDNFEFRQRFNKTLAWAVAIEGAPTGSFSPLVSPSVAGIPGTPPRISSVTINGGDAVNFSGPQGSRIVNVIVIFDEPVQLDAQAMTLALHTTNVTYAGVLQPDGMRRIPDLVLSPSADNTTWTVTFAGSKTDPAAIDGYASLVDGVYDFHVDGSKVHPAGFPVVNMVTDSTTTFARFFGDTDGSTATANGLATDYSMVVNTGDNFAFRNAFNDPSAYKAYLDFNGDGVINTGDNFEFRARFNKALTWTA